MSKRSARGRCGLTDGKGGTVVGNAELMGDIVNVSAVDDDDGASPGLARLGEAGSGEEEGREEGELHCCGLEIT